MNGGNDAQLPEACVVLSTFASEEDAARVGRELIERRLAACVNLIRGVRSIYRWQNRVEDEAEVLAVMKTSRDRVAALVAALPSLHPYEVPEILALAVAGGSPSYLDWLARESGSGGAAREGGS